MLSQVRGALKGAVAWVVIILLVAAFALWGVPQTSQLFSSSAVTVGGESFSQRTVSREFDQTFQRAARESGGGLTREAAVASGMPQVLAPKIPQDPPKTLPGRPQESSGGPPDTQKC